MLSRGASPHGNLAVSICLQENTFDRAGHYIRAWCAFTNPVSNSRMHLQRLTSSAPSISAAAELENSVTEAPPELWGCQVS